MASPLLERESFSVDQSIFRDGDAGDRAFIIPTGQVEIIKEVDGKERVLGTIGKGGVFGEMALIDDQPRMASARATEATTLIVVTRMIFEQKLAKTDPFVRALLRILVENVRSNTARPKEEPADPGELVEESSE